MTLNIGILCCTMLTTWSSFHNRVIAFLCCSALELYAAYLFSISHTHMCTCIYYVFPSHCLSVLSNAFICYVIHILISLNANCIWIWRVFVLWFFIDGILFAINTQCGFLLRGKSLKILYVMVKFHLMRIVNIGLSICKVIIYYLLVCYVFFHLHLGFDWIFFDFLLENEAKEAMYERKLWRSWSL